MWIPLASVFLAWQVAVSTACQGFTATESYRNGPYVGFRRLLTKTTGLDFRNSFGTMRSMNKGLYFFTFSSDAPLTLRKNRMMVAANYHERGHLTSTSAVLYLQPGDTVYLYAKDGPIRPFSATFSGFMIGDVCYGGGGFGGGEDTGFNGDGGGYNGGRFPGSQQPGPAIFGRSAGRGNRTVAASSPIEVVENLGQPDNEDKILELIK